MKAIEKMNYEELKEEIKYIVNLPDEQLPHHSAYLAYLADAFAKIALQTTKKGQ